MSIYRMSDEGEWIRVNPDGSKWEISAEDKAKHERGRGRPPRLYRGIPKEELPSNAVAPTSASQVETAKHEPLESKPHLSSELRQEPALGTDFELPLPECYVPLPIPIQYQPISSIRNTEAYRIVELKEECMSYKEQYRLFRQYIESPSRIELDNELNSVNTWSATRSAPKVQTGKRGGRYTIAVTKDGQYYRRYF
jgi:hypothetical protein